MEGIIARPLKLRHVLLRSFPVAVVEIRNTYTMFFSRLSSLFALHASYFRYGGKIQKIVVRSLEYFV
jgi:hypothetical protein